MESIKRITDLLNSIPITPNNKKEIEGAKQAIVDGDFHTALSIIQNLNKKKERQQEEYDEEESTEIEDNEEKNNQQEEGIDEKKEANNETEKDEDDEDLSVFLPLGDEDLFGNSISDENYQDDEYSEKEDEYTENGDSTKDNEEEIENEEDSENYMYDEKEQDEDNQDEDEEEFVFETEKDKEKYPVDLRNVELEKVYIGLLLTEPKYIVRYYILFDQCYFESESLLNIYKSILFTEGGNYTPEIAKQKFNFSREVEGIYQQKYYLKQYVAGKNYNMEKIYTDLRKICLLRKKYVEMPIESIQKKIVEIAHYKLYDKMTIEEVENATNQVTVTDKFKQAVLNTDLTSFLERGDNNLANGLSLPFPILTQVFKGIRKGETMAIAMPSNAGKSRLTVNIAAYTSLVHQKKVLIISNEMSEEKMKLTLITTILNHPAIQKLHGQKLHISETELLEFKFRPDDSKIVKIDKDGYVLREKNESREDFIKRLEEVSSDFKKTIAVTNWINTQVLNSIYFINITDHTNDELQKVIMNYYYKEKIEYVFYDTLKTDTANIGVPEEIKRTATILSNLAQNFNLYICSTLQLAESDTLPVNLDVNDLAVSRTVKEVLDTLCLIKQINRDTLKNYEYSLKEVDTKFYDLKKYDDPDVRYYACVVDKNRAGAKPTLVFRLNLAYNVWNELGYLRLKQ